jgi:hypothetical protein
MILLRNCCGRLREYSGKFFRGGAGRKGEVQELVFEIEG